MYDLEATVYVVGNRVGIADAENQLVALTDAVFAGFGGTRGVAVDGFHLSATSILPRTVTVAGLEYGAYFMSIESQTTTC